MPASLIRSRAMITHAMDRHRWNEIAEGAVVQEDGIITLIVAILILRSLPSSTEWVIGTLVGISMLFSGAARLVLSLAARRVVSKVF